MPLKTALAEFERNYLRRVLTGSGGRKSRAAEILGLSGKAIREKLRGWFDRRCYSQITRVLSAR